MFPTLALLRRSWDLADKREALKPAYQREEEKRARQLRKGDKVRAGDVTAIWWLCHLQAKWAGEVVFLSSELSLKYNLGGNPPHNIFQGAPQTRRTDDDAESGLIEPCFGS